MDVALQHIAGGIVLGDDVGPVVEEAGGGAGTRMGPAIFCIVTMTLLIFDPLNLDPLNLS